MTCEFNWDDIRYVARQPETELNLKTEGHLYHFPYNFNPVFGPDNCYGFAEAEQE